LKEIQEKIPFTWEENIADVIKRIHGKKLWRVYMK
jgi:hypothetical protein